MENEQEGEKKRKGRPRRETPAKKLQVWIDASLFDQWKKALGPEWKKKQNAVISSILKSYVEDQDQSMGWLVDPTKKLTPSLRRQIRTKVLSELMDRAHFAEGQYILARKLKAGGWESLSVEYEKKAHQAFPPFSIRPDVNGGQDGQQ